MHFWQQTRRSLSLAVPIVVGLLVQQLIHSIDLLMLGRIGYTAIAAATLGGTAVMVPLVLGFGICTAMQVLVAQAKGRENLLEGGDILRQGLQTAAAYGLLAGLALAVLAPRVGLLGAEAEVNRLAQAYIVLVGWSILPTILAVSIKNYCESMGFPWLPLGVLLASLLVNTLLNWIFIFGALGAPRLEVAGAGLATLLSRIFQLAALGFIVLRSPRFPLGWRARSFLRLELARLRALLAVAVPASLQILFEVGLFVFAAVMMGWLGTAPLAAHGVTIQVAALAFMVPLGISFATSIRVGNALGRGDLPGVRAVIANNLLLSLGFTGLYAVAVIAARGSIPELFDVDEAQTRALTSRLLVIAGLFAVFDGVQVVTLGALRGLLDVRVPMFLVGIAYWGIGLGTAAVLGFAAGLGAAGIWLGLLAGLAGASLMLLLRLRRTLRSLERPAIDSRVARPRLAG